MVLDELDFVGPDATPLSNVHAIGVNSTDRGKVELS